MLATGDYLEFLTVVRENYATPEQFKSAHELYERGKRFTARYPELQSTKAYLDGIADLGDTQLKFAAQNLMTQLGFKTLWGASDPVLKALPDSFGQFKNKYSLAYRKAHRAFHETMAKLQKELEEIDDKLTVIERLNGLEIGMPVGPKLMQEVRTLSDKVRSCALKDTFQPDEHPCCTNCKWDGKPSPPVQDVQGLVQQVESASNELCKRVTQEAIRKILEQSGEPSMKTLLDMNTASKIEGLAKVLTPDMVQRIKGILAAANIEHRDLLLTALLEEITAVEEQQVDDLLKRLRQRLLAAFDKAKTETGGKKRIRFLLK